MAQEAGSQAVAYVIFLNAVKMTRPLVFFSFEMEAARGFLNKMGIVRSKIIEVKYDWLKYHAEAKDVRLVDVSEIDRVAFSATTDNVTRINFGDRA